MRQMENTQTQKVLMTRTHVFDGLITAPLGAVIIYRVEADSSLPLQEFYVVAFYDGNTEVAWGCGTTPQDALQNASQEHDNLLSSTEGANNPFREVLMIFRDNKEGE
jgi:hypothetical protein